MFGAFRKFTERFLRIPGEPEPPPGDEASTRRFRAAPNYYYYLLVTWTLRTLIVLVALLPAEILPLLGFFTDSFERRIPSRLFMDCRLSSSSSSSCNVSSPSPSFGSISKNAGTSSPIAACACAKACS